MSEEEIIKECNELAKNEHHELGDCWDEEYSSNAIQGLLDLYNKEKEKNKENEEILEILSKELDNTAFDQLPIALVDLYISKDKIKDYFYNKRTYRQFELQQEYKDFEDDVKLNTIDEIEKELLGE